MWLPSFHCSLWRAFWGSTWQGVYLFQAKLCTCEIAQPFPCDYFLWQGLVMCPLNVMDTDLDPTGTGDDRERLPAISTDPRSHSVMNEFMTLETWASPMPSWIIRFSHHVCINDIFMSANNDKLLKEHIECYKSHKGSNKTSHAHGRSGAFHES